MKCEWAHIAQIPSGIRADSARIPLRLLRLLRIYLESKQSNRTPLGLPESDQNLLGLLGICSESAWNLLGFQVVRADSEKSEWSPSGVWQFERSLVVRAESDRTTWGTVKYCQPPSSDLYQSTIGILPLLHYHQQNLHSYHCHYQPAPCYDFD